MVIEMGELWFNPNGTLAGIDDARTNGWTMGGAAAPVPTGLNPTTQETTPILGGPIVGTVGGVAWKNGAAAQAIDWLINSNPGGPPGSAVFTLTQTATPPGTSNSSQDGYGAGTLKGLTVDQNGFIIGTFTNGQTYNVARVALSIFTNNNGLEKCGDNIWKETYASGPANVGCANDVGRGSVLGSHLEMSNVDVADEFTRLIITQRGYQANSRIVTTSDEMMQETLSLKR